MFSADSIFLEQIPGEELLLSCLQNNLHFVINNKTLKRGRLLLFKRTHYFIQFSLISEKGQKENLEVPIPFKIEDHSADGLFYFDYRLNSLGIQTPISLDKHYSQFLNKILEVQIINNTALESI